MAQVNVSLPDDLSAWAESRVADGRYGDPADYVRDLIRRDRDDERTLARLQSAIDQGRRSAVSERTIEDVIADGRRRRARR